MNEERVTVAGLIRGGAASLKKLGFFEPEKAWQSFEHLTQAGILSSDLGAVLAKFASCPDPDLAVANLERFLQARGPQAPGFSEEELGLLFLVLGGSRFLSNFICKYPEAFSETLGSEYLHKEKPRQVQEKELRAAVGQGMELEEFMARLRLYKYRELLRIALRDLARLGSFEEISRELSHLAGSVLEITVEFCEERLRKQYGTPRYQDETGALLESEFVVIGLGKLGGEELNFSSDIDLLYIYSSDKGETDGIAGQGKLTLHEYYKKLCEMLSKVITTVTADGFLYRIDLRLRPEGSRGEITNSLRSAEIYYESWGQSWERLALLKAASVAGSERLGLKFLKTVEPFVYRKYLDFTAIEEVKDLKRRMDRTLAFMRGKAFNVKLSSGGIREIEFFLQALQVINGGKNLSIRERNSLKALAKLREHRLLSHEDYQGLKSAYIFLRTLENRIQLLDERQLHEVPTEERARTRLARSMGYASFDAMNEALSGHRDMVAKIYDRLFYGPEREVEEEGTLAFQFLFEEGAPGEEVAERLTALGFADAGRAAAVLDLLRDGPPFSHFAPRARRALRRIGPTLLKEISACPDPDMALINLENFISRIGARTIFYSLLAENPKVIKLLVSLFGTSQFLSRLLINHPELIDSLVTGEADLDLGHRDIFSELSQAYSPLGNLEEKIDVTRRFKNLEELNIGIRDIYGEIEPWVASRRLSELADACVRASLEIATQEILLRYQPPEGPEAARRLAVVGLGKLGGQEINYGSDLDLIFVYASSGSLVAETRPGIKVLSDQEFFSRLCQRVISALATLTKEGFLFKVDTRLRPSGAAGTLVSSLESFKRYHEESSQTWERQALIKARFVAGDERLGQELMEIITSFVYGRPFPDAMATQMRHTRMRMEKELARETAEKYNIKTGYGGMVDVEFLVQLLQLRHGTHNPEVRKANTLAALDALYGRGFLARQEYEDLKEGYNFLRRLENRLRIVNDLMVDELAVRQEELSRLAGRMGYGPEDRERASHLLEEYRVQTTKVREIYLKYFQPGPITEKGVENEPG